MGLGLQPRLARAIFPLSCAAARTLAPRQLAVLTYHRIGTPAELGPAASVLAECTTETFAEQMRWLREHADPVDVATAVAILDRRQPPPRRPVLVTFDDGYRDDLARMRPVCERFGIRPVIYLPTGFVGTRRRFWWDRVAMCIKLTARSSFRAPLEPEQLLPLGSPAEREAATELLLPHVEHLAPGAQEELIAVLEERLGLGCTALADEPVVVGWEEARAALAWCDFGAHTITHPRLSTLAPEALRREIAESKAEIERELGAPCETFAVPYGGAIDYTEEAVRVADEVGLRVVFSLEDSLRTPRASGRCWQVDRLTLNEVQDAPGLAAKLTWPKVFVPKWTQILRARLEPALRALRPSAEGAA